LHDPEYRRRWEAKLAWYRANAILPFQDGGGENGTLITSQDTPDGGISSIAIDGLISRAFGGH
jgi:hypothetical protein